VLHQQQLAKSPEGLTGFIRGCGGRAAMTNKQRILQMVQRWPENIPFEKALYHMHVMKEVMEGLKDAEKGRVVEHDELFDELEQLT
jgi:hypothetical protein